MSLKYKNDPFTAYRMPSHTLACSQWWLILSTSTHKLLINCL